VPRFEIQIGAGRGLGDGSPNVQFGGSALLSRPLRGRRLETPETRELTALGPDEPGEVMASVGGFPVWSARTESGRRVYRTSIDVLELAPREKIADYLNGERFLRALPLYHFLRAMLKADEPEPSAWRACLVVDDPNLHSLTYGRIQYRALLDLAREAGFHAAMATIPLDAWWIDEAAAALFRTNPRHLSLLIHGNDHGWCELAQDRSPEERLASLAQVLRRIAQLERKSGVEVHRIMAPPHGACSEAFMDSMLRLGFDGVTTNRWSLWKFNDPARRSPWPGLEPADVLGAGMPVVNRFRFKSSLCLNEIVLGAYLGQPLIPYGHHQDFVENFKTILQTVEWIHSLGAVEWTSMRGIFERNYRAAGAGDVLRVQLFSRNARVVVPAGIAGLEVDAGHFPAGHDGAIEVRVRGTGAERSSRIASGERLAVIPGDEVTVQLRPGSPVDFHRVRSRRAAPLAVLRRVTAEIKDRLSR
jgi:hypothetical protein